MGCCFIQHFLLPTKCFSNPLFFISAKLISSGRSLVVSAFTTSLLDSIKWFKISDWLTLWSWIQLPICVPESILFWTLAQYRERHLTFRRSLGYPDFHAQKWRLLQRSRSSCGRNPSSSSYGIEGGNLCIWSFQRPYLVACFEFFVPDDFWHYAKRNVVVIDEEEDQDLHR